uniref:Uncharacterized protein n=1 Tax=Ciona savignyi TaxID=51511 RepID=H2YI99_CIOSA
MAKFTLFISLLLIVIVENGNCGRYVKLKDGVDEAPDSDDERYEFRPSSDVVQDLMQVTRILEIGDDHKAWVIDNAVRHEDFTDFVEIVRGGGRDFTFAHQNYTKFDGADWNYGSAPWIK